MPKKTFGADLYGKGENPNGMVAQTADETVRNAQGCPPQQRRFNQQSDGARWNGEGINFSDAKPIEPRTYPKHDGK